MLSTLLLEEPPSDLHPGKIKWIGHSKSPDHFIFSVRMLATSTRSTTISSSPWKDEMERIFSLRNHRSVLSSQCEDAFYTVQRTTISSSPWQDKVE
ncbi:hypothetical protein T09_2018, partial [Trichinella sp. T9]